MQTCLSNLSRIKLTDSLPTVRMMMVALITATTMGLAAPDTSAQDTKRKIEAGHKAITQEEADEFAQSLFDAVENGDLEQTNRLVSWEELVDRGTKLPNLPDLKETRRIYNETLVQTFQKPGSLFSIISDVVKK